MPTRKPARAGRRPVPACLSFDLAIRARGIVGLIPQVPTQNAIIGAELVQHAGNIVAQSATVVEVIQVFSAWALHLTGVVDPRLRGPLASRFGERIPT